jgi:hypothetical protein
VLLEHRQAHAQFAVRLQGEGAAVEHQFVLAPDLVHIDQRQAGLGDPPAGHDHPLVVGGAAIGRAVRDQQDLRAAVLQVGADRR